MSEAVALLKEHLALSTLVGRYVNLEKKGGKLACCCPFHQEKTPSCYIHDNKGFYHCFGCGKGGDLINFAMDIEGLSFIEALDFLADIAGIELPKRRGPKGPSRDVIEALRAVYADSAAYFHNNLRKHKPARDYLLGRGIKENTIKLFRLGWANADFEDLLDYLRNKHEPKILAQSGLFREGRSGKPYDLFRERIIFPIRDPYGHTIAFGGRLMEGDGPKYINSPESALYKKGKQVFNLDFAKAFLKRKPEVLVTEGYMDAVQVYQAGIGGVIAGLGTAFTMQQAKLLKRFAGRVLLNFDADAAGFKAARASIETFLALDMEIGVISLPDKQDPDDFIKNNGVDAYREQMESASGFYDYLLDFLRQGKDADDPHTASNVAREMIQTLHKIKDDVVRYRWIKKLSDDLEIPYGILEKIYQTHAEDAEKQAEREKKREFERQKQALKPKQPKRAAPPQRQQPQQRQQPPMQYDDGPPPMQYDDAPPPEYHGEPMQYDDAPPMQYGDVPPMQYGEEEPVPMHYGDEPPMDYGMAPPMDMQMSEFIGAEAKPPANPFNKIEEEFLFHVMHRRNFKDLFDEEKQKMLEGMLGNVFSDRDWVLGFIYGSHDEDLDTALASVPDHYHGLMRGIFLSDAYDTEDDARLEQLFPDLMLQMLRTLSTRNKQRIRLLPDTETKKKQDLMRKNAVIRKQIQDLKIG